MNETITTANKGPSQMLCGIKPGFRAGALLVM